MILTWLSLTGCEPLGPIPADIQEEVVTSQSGLFIQPTMLAFSDVVVAEELPGTLSFTITNIGDEDRTVDNHTNVLISKCKFYNPLNSQTIVCEQKCL